MCYKCDENRIEMNRSTWMYISSKWKLHYDIQVYILKYMGEFNESNYPDIRYGYMKAIDCKECMDNTFPPLHTHLYFKPRYHIRWLFDVYKKGDRKRKYIE